MDAALGLGEPFSILLVLGAYLIGGIPSGAWLARLAGIDVQRVGSGNIGATNVARTAGTRLGLLTLAADIIKGALPVGVSLACTSDLSVASVTGGAAVSGHLFPPLLRFRGGKGVATAAGVFLALAPLAMLVAIVVFATAVATSRYISLGSMLAALTLPMAAGLLDYPSPVVGLATLVAGAILVRHRDNLDRLRHGREPKFHGSR